MRKPHLRLRTVRASCRSGRSASTYIVGDDGSARLFGSSARDPFSRRELFGDK